MEGHQPHPLLLQKPRQVEKEPMRGALTAGPENSLAPEDTGLALYPAWFLWEAPVLNEQGIALCSAL